VPEDGETPIPVAEDEGLAQAVSVESEPIAAVEGEAAAVAAEAAAPAGPPEDGADAPTGDAVSGTSTTVKPKKKRTKKTTDA
jgi:hypothetical protein